MLNLTAVAFAQKTSETRTSCPYDCVIAGSIHTAHADSLGGGASFQTPASSQCSPAAALPVGGP